MFNLVFYQPEIPPNTGNAIRLVATTGVHLHLIEPLGFNLSDQQVRRAGLDYHDLARVTVHPSLEHYWRQHPHTRTFAFTSHASGTFDQVTYQPGDTLLFGPESAGLPAAVLTQERITAQVRIPMLPQRRSLNLSNAAAVAIYEAWRQHGYQEPGLRQGSMGN